MNRKRWIIGAFLLLILVAARSSPVSAQVCGPPCSISCQVTVAASNAANSTLLFSAVGDRQSYCIYNTSGTDISVCFVSSGTPAATTGTCYVQKAGVNKCDSVPGVNINRIVAQSTTTSSVTISIEESSRITKLSTCPF